MFTPGFPADTWLLLAVYAAVSPYTAMLIKAVDAVGHLDLWLMCGQRLGGKTLFEKRLGMAARLVKGRLGL